MLCGSPRKVTELRYLGSTRSEGEMNRRKWFVGGIFLAGVSAATAFMHPAAIAKADDAKPAVKTEPWRAEDEIFQEYAAQLRISPDAKWLVWLKSTADKE